MRGEAQGLKKELSELVQAQRVLLEQADIQAWRVQEQRAEARDMRDEAASQGRLVTVFTIISGIFLPLGFFSTASIAFTKPLILFLADVSPCSISALATTTKEMALLAPPYGDFGPLQPRPRSSYIRSWCTSSFEANTSPKS